MPTLLLSFKRNSDSRILLHGTLTPNEKTSEEEMAAHAATCPKFGPARKAGDTIEVAVEVNAIPDFTEEDINEWVDEMFGLEGDEGDGETEEEEVLCGECGKPESECECE